MTPRLVAAALVLLAYGLLCAGVIWRHHGRRQRALREQRALSVSGDADCLTLTVLHASQGGHALALAQQTAHALHRLGHAVHLHSLGSSEPATWQASDGVLFIVSTTGEGDAPDEAAGFVARCVSQPAPAGLAGLRYAVLALGDRHYRQYCAFGRALDGWLLSSEAEPLFPRIDMDGGDPSAFDRWLHELQRWASPASRPAPPCASLSDPAEPPRLWRLHSRQHLNPGSAGEPCMHLEFRAIDGTLGHWEAGDLIQLSPPGEPQQPRSYSVASLPQDGSLQLLVRQHRRPDGQAGVTSTWLCQTLQPGDTVTLQLRAHPLFRMGDNAQRPLLLIGTGSGMGALRAHLHARALQPAPTPPLWLVVGERQHAHDRLYDDELQQWRANGLLTALDQVFSRDEPQAPYVQDRLRRHADRLTRWAEQGLAIYVCGSPAMAAAVDRALRDLLGDALVQQWQLSGRYRRELF